MLGSTRKSSLKSIPHGLPGVASSMNLPNSGWKIGKGSAALQRSVMRKEASSWEVRERMLGESSSYFEPGTS